MKLYLDESLIFPFALSDENVLAIIHENDYRSADVSLQYFTKEAQSSNAPCGDPARLIT